MNRRIIVGVAGGTGSGKTTFVQALLTAIDSPDVTVIQHDSYYRDQSHLAPAERRNVNYDHPTTLETSLLVTHLQELSRGFPVRVPIYDFTTHTRLPETRLIEPRRIILVEGILLFTEPYLRRMMGLRIFMDTNDDIRFIRRLERDVTQRGRTVRSVIDQYLSTVRPMHLEFVQPTKRYAHVIVPGNGETTVGVETLAARILSLIHVVSVSPIAESV